MTLDEFKAKLKELNISENSYSFDGSLEEGRVILYDSYGIWNVFHYERGNKDLLGMFASMEDALDHLYREEVRTSEL